MAAPEPPPAGIANFVVTMPVQSAIDECILAPWISSANTAQIYDRWPMVIDVLGRRQMRRPVRPSAPSGGQPCPTQDWNHSLRLPTLGLAITVPADEPKEAPPAECTAWVRAPQPEPVFSFVQPASALAPSLRMLAPRSGAKLQPLPVPSGRPIPALCRSWMPVPQPEPVSAFVQPVAALNSLACPAVAPELLLIHFGQEPFGIPTAPAAHAPEPEAVSSFVQPSVALDAFVVVSAAPLLPIIEAELESLPVPDQEAEIPAACEYTALGSDAEPVWALVRPAVKAEAFAPAVLEFPRFTAEIEPFPLLDGGKIVPAACQKSMRAPSPEPVFSFLRASVAGEAGPAIAARAPGFDALHVAGPHIPSVTQFRTAPQAEPVMAGVWPHVADIPFEPILGATALRLPQIDWLSTVSSRPQVPAAKEAAPAAAAEAVEILLTASQVSTLLSTAAAYILPQTAAFALAADEPAFDLAKPVVCLAPESLESILAASTAGQVKSATVVRLQPFAVAASEERTVPGFDAPRLAPPASQPQVAAAKVMVVPMPTIHVTVPEPKPYQPVSNLPQPGLLPLEFHAQRLRADATARLDWKSVRFSPLPPRFRLRTVWEKAEDLVTQKPLPKKSNIAEVFEMPEAKPKSSKWVGWVAKIAAGIVVIMATWYGAGSIKMDHSLAGRTQVPAVAPGLPAGPITASSGLRGAAVATSAPSKGPLARVRETIAQRASVQYNDNLREGMEAWGAAARTYPAGWSRSAEGYVSTGALALFNPTRNFTDYQLEFFGQIENKSMGWTVRAKDANNYHAMKFSVIEAGLRPIIAMVHYDVIGGKAGHKMQTPLNVMVHNRTPIQVAVNVKGNRFVTSIDGEEVDSYIDDALPAGGVGFFSDAGEKARLYWVKVSKNDDWLGHVCALLAGAKSATAELRAPELPGSPAPWNPGNDRASLAGAWIAFPYVTASRRARHSKSQRTQSWNI